jgi:hypothetical protein
VACQNISDLILLELVAHQNCPGEVSQKSKLNGGDDGIQNISFLLEKLISSNKLRVDLYPTRFLRFSIMQKMLACTRRKKSKHRSLKYKRFEEFGGVYAEDLMSQGLVHFFLRKPSSIFVIKKLLVLSSNLRA